MTCYNCYNDKEYIHIHNYIKNALETDTLPSCLENQAFLPFQLEAALGALTLFAGAACHFVAESDWGPAAFFAFLTTATTLCPSLHVDPAFT